MGHGFPRRVRLRRSADFRAVQRGGRKVGSKNLVVLWRPATDGGSRFGLTVSRRVGNAVVRNRVKRWLREAIRHHQGEVQVTVDVVFIARPSAASAGAAAIAVQVKRALARIQQQHEARA